MNGQKKAPQNEMQKERTLIKNIKLVAHNTICLPPYHASTSYR